MKQVLLSGILFVLALVSYAGFIVLSRANAEDAKLMREDAATVDMKVWLEQVTGGIIMAAPFYGGLWLLVQAG